MIHNHNYYPVNYDIYVIICALCGVYVWVYIDEVLVVSHLV